ncbi:MAG: ParB N-terminal domain-containing protein [Candidatus Sericytochromatia bacterium]
MSSKLQAFDNLNFETITANKPDYKQVEWTFIKKDVELNVREEEKYTNDPELHDLAYSIIKFGLRQPIVLYKDKTQKNFYKIWHGQRRYSAIQLIQEKTQLEYYIDGKPYTITKKDKDDLFKIPCIILPEPEDSSQRILKQIAENEHRKDVDNLELCKQYHELLKKNVSWNQEVLAEKIGKSKQLVSDICGLKRIEAKIQKLISEIQLYGFTLKTIEEKKVDINKTENNSKRVGIKLLRTIATSKNQNETFWSLFGNKCSEKDAEFLGYTIETKKENESKVDDFSKLNSDYLKAMKKLDNVEANKKDKYLAKKTEIAKNLIKKLLEDNKISINDLK